MTPMQQQYSDIKAQYPADIVLFRLGDFYESFHQDAQTLSEVIGLTLTGRGKGDNRIPMAGIPYHALDNYLPKILSAGYKVVMVDQLTDPQPGQLVERGITKIYTPGTLTEEHSLDESQSNFMAAVAQQGKLFGCAFGDVSTGTVSVFETSDLAGILQELQRVHPAEVVIPTDSGLAQTLSGDFVISRFGGKLTPNTAYQQLCQQFQTKNLKGFGIEELEAGQMAVALMLGYLRECQRSALAHIRRVHRYHQQNFMYLDAATIRNLELIYPSHGTDMRATVYHTINDCHTSMGKRLLRDWLLHPLLDAAALESRWQAIDFFLADPIKLSQLREALRQVADIERIVGRVGVDSANARDLVSLAASIAVFPQITALLQAELPELLMAAGQHISAPQVEEIGHLIRRTLLEEPSALLNEGRLIADGVNPEVDELRQLKQGGRQMLAEIQARESARTGIPSLKVSYNKVFGYYIEVTHSHSSKVPPDYIRKQTLTNAERFITQELKEWEDKILHAEEKLYALEYQLFVELRTQVATQATELLDAARAIATLDVLTNFATLAREHRYARPQIVSTGLDIKAGRHPVVERLQPQFTPNDVSFDEHNQVLVLTGPNMSGKSTYIRQVALLVLLAQIGSFVPASSMQFALLDRIFTRVGAADNLSRGESTFMVEMNETANILNNATASSLIIFDEVGRGTSTYDGVAIAWSIVEFIATDLKAKTLFATHYHELTELEHLLPGVANYHVEVMEAGDQVVFKHHIARGGTSKSYGVHVAEMAGIPKNVTTRAKQILSSFEASAKTTNKLKPKSSGPSQPRKIHPGQLGLLSE